MSRRGQFDIPLRRDATGRFLPWMIALMVYLAALALAAALVLSDLARRWEAGLSGGVTIQVSPPADDRGGLDRRVQQVLGVLANSAEVRDARALPREEAAKLVEPWLGGAELVADLPLPALVDVRLVPGADVQALEKRVESAVPGAVLEDPARWLADLRRLATAVQALAVAIIALVGGAAVATVIYAAAAGFAVHRSEVELLHVIGASDGYVAAQFQRHVLRLTLAGGAVGFGLALLTLLGLERAGRNLDAALLPEVALGLPQLALLLAVPAVACLLAALAARVTVMRALGKLP